MLKAKRSRKQFKPEPQVVPSAGNEATKVLVFCDRVTGVARFQIESDSRGQFSIDHAASLLAMHCMVGEQAPGDYTALTTAEEDMINPIRSRANQLLRSTQAVPPPLQLSRREQQVLSGILQNLANKEIAARLCVADRTVKFHVSSLLKKFHVKGRIGLMLKASSFPWSMTLPKPNVRPPEPSSISE